MPEDEQTQEIEETEELDFLEMDELFEDSEAKLCNNCRWFSFTDNGVEKNCKLIAFINAQAEKKGKPLFTESFSCNRWAEVKEA